LAKDVMETKEDVAGIKEGMSEIEMSPRLKRQKII